MPAFGSNAKLFITNQNSFGTPTDVGSWHTVPFASQDLNFSFGELVDDSIFSRYDEADRVTGISGVEGSITANVHPYAIGHFLRGCFGIYAVTSDTGPVYTHVFNPQTTPFGVEHSLPPYALYVDQGESGVTSGYILGDCFINQIEFNLSAAAFLRATANVVGKTTELIQKVTGEVEWPATIKPLIWSATSISIGGAAVQRYADITLTFNNNIGMQDRIAGAKEHTFFHRDGFRMFGRMSGTMDVAMTDWLNVKNETEARLFMFCSNSIDTLLIDLPRFVFTAHPIGVSGPGIVTISVEGRAMYSTDSGTIATVTLVNTLETYKDPPS